jgi:hypothetical protein
MPCGAAIGNATAGRDNTTGDGDGGARQNDERGTAHERVGGGGTTDDTSAGLTVGSAALIMPLKLPPKRATPRRSPRAEMKHAQEWPPHDASGETGTCDGGGSDDDDGDDDDEDCTESTVDDYCSAFRPEDISNLFTQLPDSARGHEP